MRMHAAIECRFSIKWMKTKLFVFLLRRCGCCFCYCCYCLICLSLPPFLISQFPLFQSLTKWTIYGPNTKFNWRNENKKRITKISEVLIAGSPASHSANQSDRHSVSQSVKIIRLEIIQICSLLICNSVGDTNNAAKSVAFTVVVFSLSRWI